MKALALNVKLLVFWCLIIFTKLFFDENQEVTCIYKKPNPKTKPKPQRKWE